MPSSGASKTGQRSPLRKEASRMRRKPALQRLRRGSPALLLRMPKSNIPEEVWDAFEAAINELDDAQREHARKDNFG